MKHSVYFLIIALFISCVAEQKSNPLMQKIQGSWVDIQATQYMKDNQHAPLKIPFGVTFQDNTADFFRQFLAYDRDTITRKMIYNTYSGFIPYQLKSDSLFIKHPLQNNASVFKYTIDASKKDTLLLKRNDSIKYTLVPLPKIKKDSMTFDQVVFSRSGCFGSCPIMNISIHRDGTVLFFGEHHTDYKGLYSAKLTTAFTDYVFEKLEAIQISKVDSRYSVGHTDDETISSTFIDNGKIVKTISDYGAAGTKEMLWAYSVTLNLWKQLKLTAVAFQQGIPSLDYVYFDEDDKRLFLQKSESFVLWNALQSATTTTTNFESTYIFSGDYSFTYLKRIETNGQLFKIYLKNGHISTYDIGYNFMERNFKEVDFKILN